MNKEMHIAVLRRLRNAVRRKLPEKWKTNNSWFPVHDNAPAHRPVLVKDFLAKKNMTMQHLPYSQLQLIFTCSLDRNQH